VGFAAALILGCVPRRASRSQRYSNPGCYLNTPPGPPVGFSVKETLDNNGKSNSVSSPALLLQRPAAPLDHTPSSNYQLNPNPNFNHSSNPNGGIYTPTYPVLLKPGPSNPNCALPSSTAFNHSRYYGGGSENSTPCEPYNRMPCEQVQQLSMAQKRQLEVSSNKSCDLSLRLSLGLGIRPPTPPWFDSSCSNELEDAASTSSYDDTYKLSACPGTRIKP
jgi:hypothetical protein